MAKPKQLAPGYNSEDLKTRVKKGPKPAKAAPGVKGFTGATGGPATSIKGGKGK